LLVDSVVIGAKSKKKNENNIVISFLKNKNYFPQQGK
jgi:hypothetical protein